MPDSKITALASTGTGTDPANDPLVIVDVSDTSMAATGTTKKVTLNQLLACSPTATLASATITGDLTVDTNVLKVDSANNRVGINMTPITPLSGVIGTTGAVFFRTTDPAAPVATPYIQAPVSTGFSSTAPVYGFWYQDCGISNPAVGAVGVVSGSSERYRIAADGVATWSNVGGVAGTAMTLNASGLGVGKTPSYRLDVEQNSTGAVYGSIANSNSSGSGSVRFRLFNSGDTSDGFALINNAGASGQVNIINYKASSLALWTNSLERMTLDSAGNVGVGVTPSAWFSSDRALEFREGWGSVSSSNGTGAMTIANNAYESASSVWTYKNSNGAGRYEQLLGVHRFFTAPSGTAGNAITFTQAMTLDASGRLILLASTTTPATLTTNGELTMTATSNTNLRFSYRGSDGATRVANITLA
jgi:hypothetical protein